ncbi:MAG: hypothetical protein ABIY70_14395 [Capsulimonas sp.]|uniref:hypothetical protein n=1 Tax=Capsulimonas sp. TaxID=2494211 RepID=UPI00326638C7
MDYKIAGAHVSRNGPYSTILARIMQSAKADFRDLPGAVLTAGLKTWTRDGTLAVVGCAYLRSTHGERGNPERLIRIDAENVNNRPTKIKVGKTFVFPTGQL